jgi:hypothetical protein
VSFHRLLKNSQHCSNRLHPPPSHQLTQSPISCSRFSAMNASDMSSGLTKTSSWSVVCLPPNSSLRSESLLFFVAMMGNGVSEELSSPKSVLLEGESGRGVFEDPPLFGEGILGTLYAFPRTKARLRVSRSSTA